MEVLLAASTERHSVAALTAGAGGRGDEQAPPAWPARKHNPSLQLGKRLRHSRGTTDAGGSNRGDAGGGPAATQRSVAPLGLLAPPPEQLGVACAPTHRQQRAIPGRLVAAVALQVLASFPQVNLQAAMAGWGGHPLAVLRGAGALHHWRSGQRPPPPPAATCAVRQQGISHSSRLTSWWSWRPYSA